jgi:hypothetical protein
MMTVEQLRVCRARAQGKRRKQITPAFTSTLPTAPESVQPVQDDSDAVDVQPSSPM